MRTLLLSLAIAASALSFGQAPASSSSLIAESQKIVAKDGRKTMVIFHASWCGWCKRFEAFLDLAEFKTLFAKSYNIVRLDVLESPDKKALENPGSEEVLNSYGGKGSGIPYFAVLDANGKVILNSRRPSDKDKNGENIGHPMAPEEIVHFMNVLKKTSKMTPSELTKVEAWLKAQKQ